MSDEWTTTRLKVKELEDLHRLKATIQVEMGKSVTLGEAVSYALNYVKTGFFESVDLSKLASNIEINLSNIALEYFPPRIMFNFSFDNRNMQKVTLKRFVCRANTSAEVEDLGEESIFKKVDIGAVEKSSISVRFHLSFTAIEVIQKLSAFGDIYFHVEGTAYFDNNIARNYQSTVTLSSDSWKRRMDKWKEKYPLTFKCFAE